MKQIAYSFTFKGINKDFKKEILENVEPIVHLSFTRGIKPYPKANIMVCDLSVPGAAWRIGDNSCLNVSLTKSDVYETNSFATKIERKEDKFVFVFDLEYLMYSLDTGWFDSVFVKFDFRGLKLNKDEVVCLYNKELTMENIVNSCNNTLKINIDNVIRTNWSLLAVANEKEMLDSFRNNVRLK